MEKSLGAIQTTFTLEKNKKIDIVVGQILSAEKIPDTDKLLKLSVDMGLKKLSKESFQKGTTFGPQRCLN